MAAPGGPAPAPAPTPGAGGGATPRLSSGRGGFDPNLMAIQLQYTRGLDDRARAARGDAELEDILGGDARLSDESIALGRDERRASVLEPGSPMKSYTGGQEPDVGAPVAGGGLMESPGMELMRMREREERMRRTQEQLLGAPAAPTAAAPGAPAAPIPLPAGGGVAQAPAEIPEEEEAAGPSALRLAAEQQMENLKQQAIAKAKEKLKAEVKNVSNGSSSGARRAPRRASRSRVPRSLRRKPSSRSSCSSSS